MTLVKPNDMTMQINAEPLDVSTMDDPEDIGIEGHKIVTYPYIKDLVSFS